ncbi:MAG: hypothetical protein D6679_00450 [Candidatus Hydrogenedentota bacterium]|nr:MAG: hypothetical protein D6679_00450 [Candidatus Hydrogenedentota bacterium]
MKISPFKGKELEEEMMRNIGLGKRLRVLFGISGLALTLIFALGGCGKGKKEATPGNGEVSAAKTAESPSVPKEKEPSVEELVAEAPPEEESTGPSTSTGEGFSAPVGGPVFYVYKDAEYSGNHYIPSGWMGDASAVSVEPDYAEDKYRGTTCMRWEYDLTKKQQGWAGVFWQNPEGNWDGNIPDAGFNLSGAKAVKFAVRGEVGGEVVNFGLGGLASGKYPDTVKKEKKGLKLSKEWRDVTIPLEGLDLRRVTFGFMWTVDSSKNSGRKKVVFYLDEIRYEY